MNRIEKTYGKKKRRKKIIGCCLILSGILSLTGATALFLYNENLEMESAQLVDEVLPVLQDVIANGTNSKGEITIMETTEIEGNEYIGILFVPDLNLELPVMSEWNNPNLRQAPCRYKGTVNESNLIIAGHNYRRHFGRLEGLGIGKVIVFTQLNGVVTEYIVTKIEHLPGNDVGKMVEGDWDLTLFTCTINGKSRVTLRCSQI